MSLCWTDSDHRLTAAGQLLSSKPRPLYRAHPPPNTHHPQRHTNPPAGGLVTLLYYTTYLKIKIARIKKEKSSTYKRLNQWWKQNIGPSVSVAQQQSKKEINSQYSAPNIKSKSNQSSENKNIYKMY